MLTAVELACRIQIALAAGDQVREPEGASLSDIDSARSSFSLASVARCTEVDAFRGA